VTAKWRERAKNKHWTNNRQPWSWAPLMYRTTRGCWKGAFISNHPMRMTTPSTSCFKVQSNNHWPQNGKPTHCSVCSTEDKPGKDLYIQGVKWCFVLTRIRFKCWNCNVRLCFTPNYNSQTNTSTGKCRLYNCKYHSSSCMDIFWIPIYFIHQG